MYQFFEEDELERQNYEDIQVRGVSVQPRLFWLDDHKISCAFSLFPPEAGKISYMRIIIEAAGGIVLSKLDPHTIPLVDEYFMECRGTKYLNTPIPEDHFSSNFIRDSVVANKIVDLNKYRCSQSKYEDYDSNRILLRMQQWSDLSSKRIIRSLPKPNQATASSSSSKSLAKNVTTLSPLSPLGRTRSQTNNTSTLEKPVSSVDSALKNSEPISHQSPRKPTKSSSTVSNDASKSRAGVKIVPQLSPERQTQENIPQLLSPERQTQENIPQLSPERQTQENIPQLSPERQTQENIPKFSPGKNAKKLIRIMKNAMDDSLHPSDDDDEQEQQSGQVELTRKHHPRQNRLIKRSKQIISNMANPDKPIGFVKYERTIQRGLVTASQDTNHTKAKKTDQCTNNLKRTRSATFPTTSIGNTPAFSQSRHMTRGEVTSSTEVFPTDVQSNSETHSPIAATSSKTINTANAKLKISPEKKKPSVVDSNLDNLDSSSSSSHTEREAKKPLSHVSPSPPLTMKNFYPVMAEPGPSSRSKFVSTQPSATSTQNVNGQTERAGGQARTPIPPVNMRQSSQQREGSLAPSLSETEPGNEIVAPMSPIDDISDDEESDRASVFRAGSTSRQRGRIIPYSTEDGRQILNVIITNKWYSNYMGVSIWRDIEEMKLFSIYRPWQGIKEHFVKKILPNLSHHKYRLTPQDLRRFERGKHAIKNSNRQPAHSRR